MHPIRAWKDERFFPAYVAAASVIVLVIQGILSTKSVQRLFGKRETSEEHVKIPEQPSSWFGKRGTATIFAFKFTRLLALLALFVLTVVSSAKVGWTWYNVALVLTSVSSVTP